MEEQSQNNENNGEFNIPDSQNEELQQEQNNKIASLNTVVVPSEAADWFSMDETHSLERSALPEFFSGKYPSKTP